MTTSPIDRVKVWGRRLRRTAPARRIAGRTMAAQYRLGAPGGRADRVVTWMLQYDLPSQAERHASVVSLVERFFELVDRGGIQLFVEAGAKESTASIRARRDCGVEHVVAFEANPYTYRRFADPVSSTGVDYRHAALTDVAGPQVLHVRLDETGAAIADGQASLLVRPDHSPGYERVTVDGVRLDDALGGIGGRVAMWVDVEGATSSVLKGAPALLSRTDVLLVEVEDRIAWDGQEWLHLDVVDFLTGFGLVPLARDQQSRYQFNVLFVRPPRDR